jgi:hypothetical protein
MTPTLAEEPWGVLTFDQREQRAAQIIDSLDGLPAAIGDGWIADRNGERAWNVGLDLTGPAGERLHVRVDEGRLRVRADLPVGTTVSGLYRSESEPLYRQITLSPTKSHAQLARDIRRRILTDYEPLVPVALAAQAAEDAFRAERERVVAGLLITMAPLGGARTSNRGRGSDTITVTAGDAWKKGGAGSVTVEEMSMGGDWPDTVHLRVHRSQLPEVVAAYFVPKDLLLPLDTLRRHAV